MDFKGQTAVLSAFVLVGMMFLVPTITEKALAVVVAQAGGSCGPYFYGQLTGPPCVFIFMGKELKGPDASKVEWVNEPACRTTPGKGNEAPDCTWFSWSTKGTGAACVAPEHVLAAKVGCDEEGSVQVKVGGGEASLNFNSPGRMGIPSTCDVKILDGEAVGIL